MKSWDYSYIPLELLNGTIESLKFKNLMFSSTFVCSVPLYYWKSLINSFFSLSFFLFYSLTHSLSLSRSIYFFVCFSSVVINDYIFLIDSLSRRGQYHTFEFDRNSTRLFIYKTRSFLKTKNTAVKRTLYREKKSFFRKITKNKI